MDLNVRNLTGYGSPPDMHDKICLGNFYIVNKHKIIMYFNSVRMAEWSKAPDSSSGPLTRAWVQIPLLTRLLFFICGHFYEVLTVPFTISLGR